MRPSRRLLIIEPDPSLRSALESALAPGDWRIHIAADPAQAITRARGHTYGVILCELDLGPAHPSGFELLQRLRSLQPHASGLLLAARGADLSALPLGGNSARLLNKPWDPQLLPRRIQEAFERHAQRLADPFLRFDSNDPKGRSSVLLVEASDEQALLVRRLLPQMEVKLARVTELDAALDQHPFDVVLLGPGLPFSRGPSALARLQTTHPTVPVLVLSSQPNDVAALEMLQLGAEDYIAEAHLLDGSFPQRLRFALERHRARQHLVYWSQHDPLTGLANRKLFDERLQEALLRTQRGGNPVSLLFLDLDGFKDVNDRHGHRFGDRVLATVGRTLLEHARRTELVARLGGDEFTVLLEGGHQEAEQAAERLLSAIESIREVDGEPISLTASVGMGSAPPAPGAEALLRSADQAMYRAKRSGG